MSDCPGTDVGEYSDPDAFLGLALKKLYSRARPEGNQPATERPVILIAEKSQEVKTAIVRILSSLFGDFEFQQVDDSVTAAKVLREGLGRKVALVFAEFDEHSGGDYLICHTRDTSNGNVVPGMENVPLIAMLGDITTLAGRFLHEGLIDSSVQKPFDFQALKRAIACAIARREGVFIETEERLRPKVLREFAEYYTNLMTVWKGDLQNISFFTQAPGGAGPDTKADDLLKVVTSIERLGALIVGIESAGEGLKVEAFRKIVHDINNVLSISFSYIPFILDADAAPSPQDAAILTRFQNDIHQFQRYLLQIRNAYVGVGAWSDIQKSHPVLQLREKLEFPEGTTFLVVDDDEAIINVCRRTIEQAGGEVVAATNRESLACVPDEARPSGVQVVLLDNNLGEGVFGYDLISLIRKKCPGVLIIAHTSDAPGLNSCPTNPYKEAGVEVVGKRDWNAISGIIRRKMKITEGV